MTDRATTFVKVDVKGAEALRRNLSQVSQAIQRRIMRKALRDAAAKHLLPQVRRAAPVQKPPPAKRRVTKVTNLPLGPLRRALSIQGGKIKNGVIRVKIATKSRRVDAFYGIFLEQGWNVRGGGKSIPARPYMAPVASNNFPAVIQAVAKSIDEQIAAELARMPKT